MGLASPRTSAPLPWEEAGEACGAPGDLDSSGVEVPSGPLTSGESILREGCWEERPIMKRLWEQPAKTALFFHL